MLADFECGRGKLQYFFLYKYRSYMQIETSQVLKKESLALSSHNF